MGITQIWKQTTEIKFTSVGKLTTVCDIIPERKKGTKFSSIAGRQEL